MQPPEPPAVTSPATAAWHRLTLSQLLRLLGRELKQFGELSYHDIQDLLLATYADWSSHKAPRLGAALAFYTMLSLAPVLIVVIAVAGWAFSKEAATGMIVGEIQNLVGRSGAEAIQALLQGAQHPGSGLMASLLGAGTLFFSASGLVAELRDAMNTIWDVPPTTPDNQWLSAVALSRERSFAFGLVLGGGFLLLVSLVLTALVSALSDLLPLSLPIPPWLLHLGNNVLTFLVITMLFTLMYRILPDVRLRWRDVVLGAAAAAVLFTIGKHLIGLYLGHASIVNSYGAAGSIVVLLIWVYYSAQIFFMGAVFTKIYTARFGSQRPGSVLKVR